MLSKNYSKVGITISAPNFPFIDISNDFAGLYAGEAVPEIVNTMHVKVAGRRLPSAQPRYGP
ncbi:hypothetical protein SAMN05660293_00374 [Dyadobacter psychrophilus]|uniref:Uncharacterized protein n=1 Tax=Dyadobacter psychrophilus TaxID=651661 RepID=A0A1T5BJ22_9BACT|nr:hypothetical protein SAMN05660293_00374 [Dyadobacter psychrophilus]